MIDMYIMIWHLKFLNLKTILRPSMVGGMPLKRTHVVPSLNIGCTPRGRRHSLIHAQVFSQQIQENGYGHLHFYLLWFLSSLIL
jgi:hypothetical protein